MSKENWFKLVAAGLLFWALSFHPYGYYQLLRWVVTFAAIYTAYQAHENKEGFWTWAFVAIAILFNPISPFFLERDTWKIIDVGAGVLFIISAYKK